MAHWEFPGPEPIEVYVELSAGSVTLAAEPTDVTVVELTASRPAPDADELISDVRVYFEGGRLAVMAPKRSSVWRGQTGLDLSVTMPAGSRGTLRTAAADISCTGELAGLDAHTASGDVMATTVTGHVEAETASGDVRLEDARADVDVRTASGDVRLARIGSDASVRTASGDVSIGAAAGSVSAVTASGDVRIAGVSTGRTDVRATSGDVLVGVGAGVGVYLDLASVTGSVTSQLDEADGAEDVSLEVKCRTVSGDIRIARASVTEPGSHGPSSPPVPATGTPQPPPPAG
jgi:Putative adhesin